MTELEKLVEESSPYIAQTIFKWASEGTQKNGESLDELSGSEQNMKVGDYAHEITIEFVIAYLELADRITFMRLGEPGRNVVMDSLAPKCLSLIISKMNLSAPGIINRYEKTRDVYSQYREMLAAPDAPYSGVLCWEIGKIMSKIIVGSNSDARVIMPVYVELGAGLIGLEEIFKGFVPLSKGVHSP